MPLFDRDTFQFMTRFMRAYPARSAGMVALLVASTSFMAVGLY